ncbi:MAG: hypothetical protein AB7E08_03520 [Candidatus Omnitrophota bacterium]
MLVNNKRNFLVLVLLFIMCVESAEGKDTVNLRNPFESWFRIKEREESKQKEEKPLPEEIREEPKKNDLQLKGILTGKRNLAIINGEIVGEGEVIEGKRILRIEKKKVILKDLHEQKETILQLPDES